MPFDMHSISIYHFDESHLGVILLDAYLTKTASGITNIRTK